MAKITIEIPDYYDIITKLLDLWEIDNDGHPIFISPVFNHFVDKTFKVKYPIIASDDSGNWQIKEGGSLGEFEED